MVAVGDSTSSGWNQPCNYFCSHGDDPSYSWVASAVSTINQNLVPASAQAWQMTYVNLAKGGATTIAIALKQTSLMDTALDAHSHSWNVVSFTGGADDVQLETVLGDYYKAHLFGVLFGERPWTETNPKNCPDTTSMFNLLETGFRNRLHTISHQ